MRMDDRGLSLVEILIVVAIMAVLTGTLTIGVSAAFSKPADECAEKIVTTLNNARITTMGKQEIKMKFCVEGDEVYLIEQIKGADGNMLPEKKTRIGKKGVKVEYKLTGSGSTYVPLDSSGLTLSFKRSTGGFNNTPEGSSSYCEEIKVSKGNRVKIIKLAYLTGKVTID